MMTDNSRLTRIDKENKVLRAMIALYCRRNHGIEQGLCVDCENLLQYSRERLANCPWGVNKPVCAQCTIHCYAPYRREHIRQVMRFSGPRMLLSHPWMAIRHLLHRFHPSGETRRS